MEAQRALIVVEGCVQLIRPMAPAVGDAYDVFAGFTADRQHLRAIVAQLLGIKMRYDLSLTLSNYAA